MLLQDKTATLYDILENDQIAIAELEAVGLPLRIINLIERSTGLIWVNDLVKLTPEELKEKVTFLGERGVRTVIRCLHRLNEMEQGKRELQQRYMPGLDDVAHRPR